LSAAFTLLTIDVLTIGAVMKIIVEINTTAIKNIGLFRRYSL